MRVTWNALSDLSCKLEPIPRKGDEQMANNTAAQQRSGLTSRPISHQERFVTQPQLRHAILGYHPIGTNLLLSLLAGRSRSRWSYGGEQKHRNGVRQTRQPPKAAHADGADRTTLIDIGSADGAYRHSSPVRSRPRVQTGVKYAGSCR